MLTDDLPSASIVKAGTGIRRRRGDPCAYCGKPMVEPTRDHPVPRSRLGAWQSLVMCCRPCNEAKDDLTLVEWRDLLAAAGDRRVPFVDAVIDHLAAIGSPLHALKIASAYPSRGTPRSAAELAEEKAAQRAALRKAYSTGEVSSTLGDVWPAMLRDGR